jgi:hypothetical protein
MNVVTPYQANIRVKPHIAANGFTRVAIVFLHGLGDTLMFRSVFSALCSELPHVRFSLFLLESQEPLIDGARAWAGMEKIAGCEVAYVIEFAMTEGTNQKKAERCAILELGLDAQRHDIVPLSLNANRLVAVHFQSTALPDSVNPSIDVCRKIYDILISRNYLPIEVHFEHIFHNPRNSRFDWFETTVRRHRPTIEKLYSLIANARFFVGVASGPFVMALAIAPKKVIFLKKEFDACHYTSAQLRTVDIKRFDENTLGRHIDGIEREESRDAESALS